MLNRVSFGGSGWIVTNGDRQTESIGHLFLQVSFPDPGAIAIASTAIGFNHELRCPGEAVRQFGSTPMGDIIDGKSRSIGRLTDIDGATIMLPVIEAVRHRPSPRLTGKIVNLNPLRCFTPDATGVLEIAHQFLFLGINTEDGLFVDLMNAPLAANVRELLISIRMLLPFLLFGVGPQGVAVVSQQATDHRQTDPVFLGFETNLNIVQTAIEPLLIAHRIARGMGLDNLK